MSSDTTPNKKKARYRCDDCGYISIHKNAIDYHNILNPRIDSKSNLKCRLCSIHFNRLKCLNYHKRQAHGMKFKCGECDKKFFSISGLKRHKFVEHRVTQRRKKTTHQVKQELPKIERKTTGVAKSVQCSICGSLLANKASLRSHNYNVHRAKYFKCRICGHLLKGKSAYKLHVANQHSKSVKKKVRKYMYTGSKAEAIELLKCLECKMTYSNQFSLYLHNYRVHRLEKIICKVCGGNFKSETSLKRHERKVHSHTAEPKLNLFQNGEQITGHVCTRDRRYSYHRCKICHILVNGPSRYSRHLKLHKSSVDRLTCPICAKILSSKCNVQRHLIEVHKTKLHTGFVSSENKTNKPLLKNLKPLSCQKCGQRFKNLASFKRHVDFVHNTGYFKCNKCGTMIKSHYELNRHKILRCKNRFYLFKCVNCEEGFANIVSFLQHEFIRHSIQCKMCGNLYWHRARFELHLAQFHGQKSDVI